MIKGNNAYEKLQWLIGKKRAKREMRYFKLMCKKSIKKARWKKSHTRDINKMVRYLDKIRLAHIHDCDP